MKKAYSELYEIVEFSTTGTTTYFSDLDEFIVKHWDSGDFHIVEPLAPFISEMVRKKSEDDIDKLLTEYSELGNKLKEQQSKVIEVIRSAKSQEGIFQSSEKSINNLKKGQNMTVLRRNLTRSGDRY